MKLFTRLKAAARILLKGESATRKRAEIPAITAEEVAEIKQFFPREKFFILGHARSGTTILMRLARLHPEVHCNYQAHFFTRAPMLKSLVDTPEAADWLSRKSNRWNGGRDLSPLVMRAAADFIMEREAAREGKRIVGDKSPSSVIHGQVVRDTYAIYPDAKLIYIVRDGRDVLISERFRNFVEDSKYLTAADRRIVEALKVDQTPFTDGRRSIFTDDFIRRVAKRWVADLTEIDGEVETALSRTPTFPCATRICWRNPSPRCKNSGPFSASRPTPPSKRKSKRKWARTSMKSGRPNAMTQLPRSCPRARPATGAICSPSTTGRFSRKWLAKCW